MVVLVKEYVSQKRLGTTELGYNPQLDYILQH